MEKMYEVYLVKKSTYYIDAESEQEALDRAIELFDSKGFDECEVTETGACDW